MRRVPVIAMTAALAVAGLAAAAWLGPRAFDWSYLEKPIGDALDREISLDGPIRLDLLPRPRLTFSDVSGIDLSVREITAVLNAWALLGGRFEVEALEVSGLDLALDRSVAARLPPLPAKGLRIEDSTVSIGGSVIPVERAALSVRGPGGPYRVEAMALVGGGPLRMVASIGRWREHIPVAVSVGNGGFEATAIGAVAEDPEAGFAFSGRLTARGEVAPDWNGAFDAVIEVGLDGAELADVELAVDEQRFAGTIRADWREELEIEADLSTGVLELDALREKLPHLAGAAKDAGLRLRLRAGAVKSGGRTARRVAAALQRDGEELVVERFTAALPGGTQVEIAGLGKEDAAFSLKTKNLRALLNWLGIDPGAVEEARLRELDLQGRLRLAGSGISPEALRARIRNADFAVEEARGRLDGARIEGRVARRGERFDLELTAEDLPLDPYRPALEGSGLLPGAVRLDLVETRLFGISAGRLEFDAEFREGGEFSVSRLAVRDAGGLTAEGSGRFGAEAASWRLSGRTADLARTADLYGLALPMVARELGAVEFDARAEGPPDALPVELTARAGARRLHLDGELAERARYEGRMELESPLPVGLAFSDDDGPAMLTASVSAEPDHAVFDDIDLRFGTLQARGRGAVSLSGERPAARLSLAATRLDLPAPTKGLPIWQRRPLDTSPFGAFELDVDLTVETLGVGSEAFDDLRLDLSLAPEAWVANAVDAGWRGGRLLLDGAFLAKEGRARLNVDLRGATLPDGAGFGPGGARTDALIDFEAEGRSPRELVSTLSGAVALNFSGGRLNGVDIAAARDALDRAATSAELLRGLRKALVSGGSPLVSGRLEARVRNGVAEPLAGGFALAGGRVSLAGSLDLPRGLTDVAGRLAFRGRPEAPPLGFAIAGPLRDPARQAEIGAVETLLLSEGVAGLVRPNAN